ADHLPGSGAPLEESALSALNQYAKDLQMSLNQFGSLTDPVLARAKSPPHEAVTLVEDLKQAERMAALEASEERDAQKWAERFGPGFRGVATDWNALRRALGWVLRVRELFAGGGARGQGRGGRGEGRGKKGTPLPRPSPLAPRPSFRPSSSSWPAPVRSRAVSRGKCVRPRSNWSRRCTTSKSASSRRRRCSRARSW